MRQRLTTCLAIALMVLSTHACSLIRSKRPVSFITLELDAPAAERAAAVNQAVAVITSRLDALRVSNFEVKPVGDPANGRIVVSLPAVSDPERVKQLVIATGKLELVHVISPPSPSPVTTYNSQEDARTSTGAALAANRRILPYRERDVDSAPQTETGTNLKKWVVVEAPSLINGSDLRQASAVESPYGAVYHVQFSLKPSAAERFGAWTGANVNEYLGVVLNDEVKSIAYIMSQIFDSGEISGRFTKQSAEDLALVLNSGALPAPVKVVEERVER